MKLKVFLFLSLILGMFAFQIIGVNATSPSYGVAGNQFYSSSTTHSGTGSISVSTSNGATTLKVYASSYWDIFSAKGGSVQADFYYQVYVGTSATYNVQVFINEYGKIFDDDSSTTFTQLRFDVWVGSTLGDSIVRGGNGYLVESYADCNIHSYFSNVYYPAGWYTVHVRISLTANGALPGTGTDYIDFMHYNSESGYISITSVGFSGV